TDPPMGRTIDRRPRLDSAGASGFCGMEAVPPAWGRVSVRARDDHRALHQGIREHWRDTLRILGGLALSGDHCGAGADFAAAFGKFGRPRMPRKTISTNELKNVRQGKTMTIFNRRSVLRIGGAGLALPLLGQMAFG